MIKYLISTLETVIENKAFQDALRSDIKKGKLLFIPSDPEGKDATVYFAKEVTKCFKNKGFEFSSINILSEDNLPKVKEDIDSYAVIFLMGGVTYTQNKFIKRIDLKSLINNYNGVFIGQSAGALNMCKDIYFSGDKVKHQMKGLDLTDLIIDVHFTEKNKEYIKNADLRTYCITDEGAIRVKDTIKCIGEVYIYDNKKIEKID